MIGNSEGGAATAMEGSLPSFSYTSNTGLGLNMAGLQAQAMSTGLGNLLLTDSTTNNKWTTQPLQTLLSYIPTPQAEEKKIVARLIRYTVVDPDTILADKAPDQSILTSGTVMLNGTDDRGFVMDLASKLSQTLSEHNDARSAVEYEDKEGKTKKLKPIKISQLDVVLEVLKSY